MFYKDFRAHVTRKYGVILEGWPLKAFVAPGLINSRPDLLVLYGAWKSGKARFRVLSPEELAAWEDSGKPVVSGINGVPLGEDALNTREAPVQPGASSAGPTTSQAPPTTVLNEVMQPSGEGPRLTPSEATTASPPLSDPEGIPSAPTEAPESSTFVMSFEGDAGKAIAPPKKRKARSDKGKPRGPNARSNKQPAKKRRVEEASAS